MDVIVSIIVGAVIAAAAIIISSHYAESGQIRRQRHRARLARADRDVDLLSALYADTLFVLDGIMRKYGEDSDEQLKALYRVEAKLQLDSTPEIVERVRSLKAAIAEIPGKLTPFPQEYVPKFEGDQERDARLEARREAAEKREGEAAELLPGLRQQHQELGTLMKSHLDGIRDMLPDAEDESSHGGLRDLLPSNLLARFRPGGEG